jgi:biotin carboxyl carrier protein
MNAIETQTSEPNQVDRIVPPTRPRRALSRRRALVGAVVAVVGVGAVVWVVTSAGNPPPAAPTPTPTISLTAHGAIQPVAHATIATMTGGVVRSLSSRVGEDVGNRQEIAEISTASQTEILVAPWRGTITGLSVHVGDTLMPGAAVATIGDLSRYQVETTDVDEYLIGQIHPNQSVTMTVEALGGRRLTGTVDTVALTQQTSSAGVANYPVVIRLFANDPELRPWMTVRLVFSSG